MKKITTQNNLSGLIIPFVFIIIGILFIILPYFSFSPKYAELEEKIITVDFFKDKHYGYYIVATNKEKYNIVGEYDYNILESTLEKGTVINIKWYRDEFFRENYIAEITIGNSVIVNYRNSNEHNRTVFQVLGGIEIAFGLFGVIINYCVYRKERNLLSKFIE